MIILLALTFLSGPPIEPKLVGSGTISTQLDETSAAFTPDGKTCFFSVRSPSTISANVMVICESHFQNGKWSEPAISLFSGKFKDFSPSISPDGNRLFFVSNRPVNGKPAVDLWMVERKNNVWGEPVNVGEPVNGAASWELGCSMTKDGTLFFSSTGDDGNPDIYYSMLVNEKFEAPVRLDANINSEFGEVYPAIAPDGSYLIFASTGRPDAKNDGYPRGDLYVSFFKDGKWTPAKNMGPAVNSAAEETAPSISSDGSNIYFVSERNFISMPVAPALDYKTLQTRLNGIANGLGNVYEIPSSILNDLR